MDRYRTLLVDDVAELRRLLRQMLEWSERFEVVGEVADGAAGITAAAELQPDLVLLDISMPGMDGLEALPLLLKASPATRVVMLSGFEAERLARAAIEMGATGYIEKGGSPTALVAEILTIMGESPGGAHRAGDRPDEAIKAFVDVSPEEMMALVAHEIRNPLAVIQGFGTELQNRWDTMPDHVRKDAVRRMSERARYLNTVVTNLMYMRKVREEPPAEELVPEEPQLLVERMIEELRDLSRDNPLELSVTPGLPAVKVNRARIRQVLTNLIVNASKFSPTGSPIAVSVDPHPRGVTVSVSDRGPGIPDDRHEEVFGKFRRLESGGAGIGLGLFISRALMDSMQGELWIESSGSDGSSPGACLVCLLPPA